MTLHIYNTASRRKERFVPGDPDRITLYVCGPTVYNYPHIGNARPEVVFDVLARMLRRIGPLVYARNLTDVDDKINAAAGDEGCEISVLTARFVTAYREDMASLGVLPPDVEPRATEHVDVIIALIERLIAAGHAYEAERHVLFSVPSHADYGALSRRPMKEMIAGARVEVAPYKRDPADFVLWKPSSPDIVGWDSPWGRGRPGWHIECSAMVEAHLGETIDIHGGGLDLVFPHHENEMAQSVSAHNGHPFARYWMHNGLVNMATEKMSKSLGNIVLVRELLQDFDGEVVRLGLLNAHYRQPLDWSDQLIQDSRQKLDRMYGVLRDAGLGAANESNASPESPPGEVLAALEDDLNTPQALAALFALARAANKSSDQGEKLRLAHALRSGGALLGLLSKDPVLWFEGAGAGKLSALPEDEIESLLARRETLRGERRFDEADAIRDQLAEAGILIEDVAGSSRWRKAH